MDRTLVIFILGLMLAGIGNWTTTVSYAARSDKTLSDVVQKNSEQDQKIEALTVANYKTSESMARVETTQKFQTDLLKDIRDEVRVKKNKE